MMSLFSSFDLMFFYLSNFILASAIFFFLGFAYVKSSINSIFSSVFFSLSEFFYSLKSKSFNKSSLMTAVVPILLIFFLNFFSVFSFNFPLTSQFSVIFFCSLFVWTSLIMFNFISNFKGFISHLIPEGTPIYLTMVLFLIETISNIIRPITLTVRLVANILAGHLLMILLSKLVFSMPLVYPFYMVLNMVEIFVSMIQAYIFTTMIVLYFSEIH